MRYEYDAETGNQLCPAKVMHAGNFPVSFALIDLRPRRNDLNDIRYLSTMRAMGRAGLDLFTLPFPSQDATEVKPVEQIIQGNANALR